MDVYSTLYDSVKDQLFYNFYYELVTMSSNLIFEAQYCSIPVVNWVSVIEQLLTKHTKSTQCACNKSKETSNFFGKN